MKNFRKRHIFVALALNLFFNVSASIDKNNRYTRDILFKRHRLNASLDDFHNQKLKSINVNLKKVKLPGLALCSLKKLDANKKLDREFFIKSIGVAVEWVNERILEHRKLILDVENKKNQKIPLSPIEASEFNLICKFYNTKDVNELLKRVAPVPVSLAIAQAALESGFGRAKYMHERNAFFGIMKNKTSLYAFDTVIDSVIAYTKSLNVHRAYRGFREQRALMIASKQILRGEKLIPFLTRYSSRTDYGNRVQKVMDSNNLQKFDYRIDT